MPCHISSKLADIKHCAFPLCLHSNSDAFRINILDTLPSYFVDLIHGWPYGGNEQVYQAPTSTRPFGLTGYIPNFSGYQAGEWGIFRALITCSQIWFYNIDLPGIPGVYFMNLETLTTVFLNPGSAANIMRWLYLRKSK